MSAVFVIMRDLRPTIDKRAPNSESGYADLPTAPLRDAPPRMLVAQSNGEDPALRKQGFYFSYHTAQRILKGRAEFCPTF